MWEIKKELMAVENHYFFTLLTHKAQVWLALALN
jgi:hypothetical protein